VFFFALDALLEKVLAVKPAPVAPA
jgi:hypothetical protein